MVAATLKLEIKKNKKLRIKPNKINLIDLFKMYFISIIRLSEKGTDGVMKHFKLHLPFVLFSCYAPLVGYWHTTEPEEVSGGAV